MLATPGILMESKANIEIYERSFRIPKIYDIRNVLNVKIRQLKILHSYI